MTEKAIRLSPVSPAEFTAHRIAAALHAAGFQAYLVGGSVRDRLLGRIPDEVDVATDATPDQVQRLFPRTVAVGAAFGVIVIVEDGLNTEVATFRTDGGYQDGRRPDAVVFSDPAHDAQRRDFTINGLFYDPRREVIIDHVGGLPDLEARIIHAIGDPRLRFAEDYLRMLRAVRFTARLDFHLDAATESAVGELAGRIIAISPERIGNELTRMLTSPHADRAFQLLDQTGLLAIVLPEIAAMKGVAQPAQYHPEGDVFVHTCLLLAKLNAPSPALAWGALLHDVGKPPTFTINDRGYEAFPNHAAVGAEMAEDILRRFRFANALIADVRELVYWHMSFANIPDMRQSTLRRMLARPTIADELELHRIDCLSSFGDLSHYHLAKEAQAHFASEPILPAPLLSGRDLLALGATPGPRLGKILADIRELQLDGQITDPAQALAKAQSMLAGG